MALDRARAHLKKFGLEDRIRLADTSTATVELAAAAVGVAPGCIAKTLSFIVKDRVVLVVCEGMARVDNRKFKDYFHAKAKMIPGGDVQRLTGHEPGGVCPFGVNDGVEVFLDVSLKQHDIVFPAAGTDNSSVRLSIEELEKCSESLGWVDICR